MPRSKAACGTSVCSKSLAPYSSYPNRCCCCYRDTEASEPRSAHPPAAAPGQGLALTAFLGVGGEQEARRRYLQFLLPLPSSSLHAAASARSSHAHNPPTHRSATSRLSEHYNSRHTSRHGRRKRRFTVDPNDAAPFGPTQNYNSHQAARCLALRNWKRAVMNRSC